MKKKGNRVSGPFRPHRLAMAIKQALPWLMGGSVALMTLNSAHGSTAEINAAFTASQLVRQFTLKNTVSQVNLGLQPRVTDPSGTPLAPAMGATISGYLPADMGTIPSTLSLPQRDGAGRPLGYCAWNNNSNVASGGYLAGLGASTPVLYAVVSAGLNGTMETSCAYILSQAGSGQPVAAGDDYVEFRTPYDVASAEFKTSVPTYTDLVAVNNPSVGEVRLVRDTNRLYAYRQTGGSSFAWAPVSIFSDDSASNGPNAVKYLDGKVTVADFAASTATLSGNLTGTTATFSGGVTANAFTGNASGLTDLNASNISSGMLSPAYGGTGVDGSAAAPGTLLIGNGAGFSLGTLTAGAGVTVLNSAGGITIANTGVLSITGTPDQIIATGSTGDVTLSLPQSISATSTPTFAGMVLNGVLSAVNGNFTGTVSAKRLILQDSDGGVNYPNTVIGVNNLVNPQSGYGENVAIGPNALASNLDGDSNIAIGNSALQYNTGGFDNLAIGVDTMRNNTDGYWNTALGNYAMYSNTTGEENVAMGYLALEHNTTGDDNVAVGLMALDGNSTGNSNSAFGPYSLWRNDSGSNNVAFGDSALEHIVTGSNNTAIGSGAGLPSVYGGNSGGNYNTFLGSETASNSAADLNYATAVGAGTIINTSNTIVLGRTTDATVIGATGTATSGILQNKILQVTGDVGISGNLTIGGTFTATGFSGNGSGLTNLNASNISSGMLSPAYGGTGVDGSTAANGQLLIGNGAGYTLGNISGTANQINVTNGSGTITLSLPQDIATTSTPTFGGMNLNGGLTGTTATFSGQLNAANIYSNGVQLKPINKANIDAALTFASDSSDQTYYGQPNLALGSNALGGAYKGAGNVAIGQDVLGQIVNTAYASDGTFNTGVGYQALYSNTRGSGNVASGFGALYSNTTGSANVATGPFALLFNTTGANNVATGPYALFSNISGSLNVALGSGALFVNTTGDHNVGIGDSALYNTNSGDDNVAIGNFSGANNATGNSNTLLGSYSDVVSDSLSYATALGSHAAVSTSNTIVLGRTTDTTVIGATGDDGSGNKLQVTGGITNTGDVVLNTGSNSQHTSLTDLQIRSSLDNATWDHFRIRTDGGGTTLDAGGAEDGMVFRVGAGTTGGVGDQTYNTVLTLRPDQSASFTGVVSAQRLSLSDANNVTTPNMVVGQYAMYGVQSGDGGNTALGMLSLNANTSGARNVGVGFATLSMNTGAVENTAVGTFALQNNTIGSNNTGLGYHALFSNTTGGVNVAVGSEALFLNTSGDHNVGIGNRTLYNTTTGSDNVAIGNYSGVNNATGFLNTLLGSNSNVAGDGLSYATAVGAQAVVSTSNTVVLGAPTHSTVIGASGTATSGILQNKKLQVTGDVGISGDLVIGGTFTAAGFSGNGSGLTNLNASNISSGMLSPAYGGTGVDGSTAANGQLLIGNGTGYTLGNISGTANQINVTNGSGTITLNLPQDIATSSSPTFAGMTLNGALNATRIYLGDNTGTNQYAPSVLIGTNVMNPVQNSDYGRGGNVAIGIDVMPSGALSGDNVAIGHYVMDGPAGGGYYNVALGFDVMNNNGGRANIAMGWGAMQSNSGWYNVGVGAFSLQNNTSGWYNIAMGYSAMYENTTGRYNVGLGYYSLGNNSSGYYNVGVGLNTLGHNTTGSHNSAVGNSADVGSGDLNYATVIGAGSVVSTSNTVVLGRTTDSTVIGATGTATSGILQNKILQVTGDVGISGNLTIGGTFTATGFSGNGSGLTNLNASNISSGMLSPAYGGTGVDGSTAANGQLLIGNGSGYSLNTLTAGTGIGISNGAGTITINNTGVTSFNGRNGAVTLTLDDINNATSFSPLNFTLGSGALPVTTTGDGNTGVGVLALRVNTTGGSNTGVGARALFYNTTGNANTALGRDAMYSNTAGVSNTAVGYAALGAATTANNNTAMGDSALTANTTGSGNTAVGKNSLFQNSTGGSNTVIGGFAMLANTSGFYNSAVGYNVGNTVTTGSFNTLLGAQSDAVSNLDHATAVGAQANVSTGNTVVLGRTVDTTVIGATGTASSGVLAGTNLQVTGAIGASGNLLVGGAGIFTGSVSTNRLVVSDTTNVSSPNIAIGSAGVLSAAQSGSGANTAVGVDTLYSNTVGTHNVSVGYEALRSADSSSNTAVGFQAMRNATGFANTALGHQSLYLAGGSGNTALGSAALLLDSTGANNTAQGANALGNNTSGSYNVAVGANAGAADLGGYSSNANTTGSNNTFLGSGALPAVSTQLNYATALGSGAQVSTSNTLVLGRAGADQVVIGATSRDDSYASTSLFVNGTTKINGALYATSVTQTSDRRLKTNIQTQDTDSVLNRLSQLSTYTYEYINHPDLGRKIGVIAQEVKPYFPEAVVTSRDGFYSVDYNALGAMAAVGVGKLNVKYNALSTEVQKQGGRLADLEGRVSLQDTRISDLEGWKSKTASRLDGMQTAIDSNIANIAASALKISMNTTRITTLEQVTTDLDKRVTLNADGIAAMKGFWNNTFETQDDGQTLALKIPNFKVSNFSAAQVKANAVYAQRLEAEVAKLKALQVDDLYAKNATAGMVHADELNTGTSETYAGVGNPGFVFSAKDDGHYTVNTSSPDGSYATATVIVYGGVAKVIPVAQQGIELFAVGNQIKANAAGKSIKASWLKMG